MCPHTTSYPFAACHRAVIHKSTPAAVTSLDKPCDRKVRSRPGTTLTRHAFAQPLSRKLSLQSQQCPFPFLRGRQLQLAPQRLALYAAMQGDDAAWGRMPQCSLRLRCATPSSTGDGVVRSCCEFHFGLSLETLSCMMRSCLLANRFLSCRFISQLQRACTSSHLAL